jgi:hypothetical protein
MGPKHAASQLAVPDAALLECDGQAGELRRKTVHENGDGQAEGIVELAGDRPQHGGYRSKVVVAKPAEGMHDARRCVLGHQRECMQGARHIKHHSTLPQTSKLTFLACVAVVRDYLERPLPAARVTGGVQWCCEPKQAVWQRAEGSMRQACL